MLYRPSSGSRGAWGAIAPQTLKLAPPIAPPPQINDAPYIKRPNAYNIAI